MTPLRRLAPLALAGVAAACGGGGGSAVTVDALHLPTSVQPRTLASTTVYTSPDGGIYRNPDPVTVTLVTARGLEAIATLLGDATRAWSPLRPLGPFTLVGLRLKNDGKAWSEPALNDLQVASDYAPPGTGAGGLRHWYHPTFPLALLSDRGITGDCSIHLDPGQSVDAVLVYPPLRLAGSIVWGRYRDFALTIPTGGALPGASGSMRAATCTPPVAPP